MTPRMTYDTMGEEDLLPPKKAEDSQLLLAEKYRRGKSVCWDICSAYSVIRASCSMSTVCFLLLRMSKQGQPLTQTILDVNG